MLSSAGYSLTQLEKAMVEVRGSRKVDSQTGDENFEAAREPGRLDVGMACGYGIWNWVWFWLMAADENSI